MRAAVNAVNFFERQGAEEKDHRKHNPFFGRTFMLGTILLIVLVLLLLSAIPAWPHSRSWGYGPSGGLGLVLIVILILVLMGYI
jgi:Protein of unknown function (DUF3309)